jgi:hypothetical protein
MRIVDGASRAHPQHPVGDPRDGAAVRDQQHRPSRCPVGLAQQSQHDAARLRIPRAGRLIAQHERPVTGERARNSDPLLLAARQLRGK